MGVAMDAKDIYPNLAVWIRGNLAVWPGTVIRIKRYSMNRGYLYPSRNIDGFMVIDEANPFEEQSSDQDIFRPEEVFCLAEELEPRDPNNLDEVPPEPLLTEYPYDD